MNAYKKIFASALLVSLVFSNTSYAKSTDYSQIVVPEKIVDITLHVGNVYDISPYLLQALIFAESSFRENAVSVSGQHFGLCQISTKYHKDRIEKFGYTVDDIFFPHLNVLVCADYLDELSTKYGYKDEDGNVERAEISLVLDLYNGNSKAFELYENGELSNYSRKILELAEELENREEEKMGKEIIAIERASEKTILKLIDLGILFIGDDGRLHCKEDCR